MANKSVAKAMEKQINKEWGGTHSYSDGKDTWTATISAKVKLGKPNGNGNFTDGNNYINITNVKSLTAIWKKKYNTDSNSSFVTNSDSGFWRGESRTKGQALSADNPAAHEFGHLLGLGDHYDSNGPKATWQGNIMAEAAMEGHVEAKNTNPLIAHTLKESGGKTGTYVHDFGRGGIDKE